MIENSKIENAASEESGKRSGSKETLLPVMLKGSVSRVPTVTIPIDRYDDLVRNEALCDLIDEVRQRVNRSDFERFICMVFPRILINSQLEGTDNA